jgi:hypothetical protein
MLLLTIKMLLLASYLYDFKKEIGLRNKKKQKKQRAVSKYGMKQKVKHD